MGALEGNGNTIPTVGATNGLYTIDVITRKDTSEEIRQKLDVQMDADPQHPTREVPETPKISR